MSDLQKKLGIAKKILRESAVISLEGFSKNPGAHPAKAKIESKSSFKDIVTEYDKKVEVFITQKLAEHFPEDEILGEEAAYLKSNAVNLAEKSTKEFIWTIDPIDGTSNYSRSYPYFCSTVALLAKQNGSFSVVLGATFDPIKNEMFTAIKGQGACLNDEKIKCSPVNTLEESLLVTGFAAGKHVNNDTAFTRFMHLTRKTLGVRRSGSAALDLAYVAVGRLDAYWEHGLSIWDIATGSLLVSEAGGVVSHFERDEAWTPWTGEILATNKALHSTVLEELKKY